MNVAHSMNTGDFWSPEFDYEHRSDGTILMRQKAELTDYLPTLADYLDKWADATPDQIWIARREGGGDWRRISYARRVHRRARLVRRCLVWGWVRIGLCSYCLKTVWNTH